MPDGGKEHSVKPSNALSLQEYLAMNGAARVRYLRAQRAWLVELQDRLEWQRTRAIARRYELERERRRHFRERERDE